MNGLANFSIPIKGLKEGLHQFDFQIDNDFFNHFEESPIKEGTFSVKLYFDKRADMIVLNFDIDGTFKTACDRCLEQINLPIKNNEQLLVKYAEESKEEAEVIYITRDLAELNLAKYVYEYICLSMPIIKVYDCEEDENAVCNEEMLKYLDVQEVETKEEKDSSNSIWDELKNFKKDN